MIVAPTADGRILLDRQALAALLQRSPRTIRRWCTPVASAVTTRAALYDVDDAQRELHAATARRGLSRAA